MLQSRSWVLFQCRYGYSFGCSSADVWHYTDHKAMLYPGYMPYSTAGDGTLLSIPSRLSMRGTALMSSHAENQQTGSPCTRKG